MIPRNNWPLTIKCINYKPSERGQVSYLLEPFGCHLQRVVLQEHGEREHRLRHLEHVRPLALAARAPRHPRALQVHAVVRLLVVGVLRFSYIRYLLLSGQLHTNGLSFSSFGPLKRVALYMEEVKPTYHHYLAIYHQSSSYAA